jgi:hypothetical protein
MATPRTVRHLFLTAAIALLTLSVATCQLDRLLKSSASVQHPVLGVNPTAITDSARAGSDDVREETIEITNDGNGGFIWSATKDKGWISLDPTEGSGPGTLTASLDVHGLAPGTYHGAITIRAKGTDDSIATVSVTLVVQRAGLVVSPGSLTHGTNYRSNEDFHDQLDVSNTGNGVLVWTASKSKSWITLGAVAGVGSGSVPVTISSRGLNPGTYTDEIVITAPGAEGSPARIAVTLDVFVPGLAVSPGFVHDSANFGDVTPLTDTLTVGISGGGALTWTASEGSLWLGISTGSGSAPPNSPVVVTLRPAGLPAGTYKDTIVFRSPEATNDPVKIPVQFDVVRAVLTVTPNQISDAVQPGDNQPRTYALAITNGGGGAFAWSASDDQPWIALNKLAGTGADTITVTVDPGGLPPGTHKGNVTVTSPGAAGSPVTVPVTLTVQAPCTLSNLVPDDQDNGTLNGNDCIAPHRPGSRAQLYSFSAAVGDAFTIRMTSAAFNSYLILVDASGNALVQNDECPGESRTACIENFAVPGAGQYTIEATTSAPGETGGYSVSIVRERAPSPPQGLGQFKSNGNTSIAIGGTTTENTVVFKGTVSDPNSADNVRLELEIEPLGSPFTNVSTHQSQYVAASRGNVTVAISAGPLDDAGYHWQARSCDATSRCSAWLSYGGNDESAADFTVNTAPPPPPPPPPPPGGSPPQGVTP